MMNSSKKHIGIITMYYNSSNYGGLLQAYALTKYLNNCGYDAKQITYDFYKAHTNLVYLVNRYKQPEWILMIKRLIMECLLDLSNYKHGLGNLKKKRRNACKAFRMDIPHTQHIYRTRDISNTINEFDCFITGSDQVWNPIGYRPTFFLNFVDKEELYKLKKIKIKMSYAASVSNTNMYDSIKEIYKHNLKDFDVISVREKSDVAVIQELTDKPVHWVLDPVFLLSKEQWMEQCKDYSRSLNRPYLFCYFLGDSLRHRQLATEYARKHGLKVVTIPYMQMQYRSCDEQFGDIKLNDVDPREFLTLINDAEAIMTDSFHATAFSIIFNKQFLVFGRSEKPEMIERIKSITDLFRCEERLCEEKNQNIYYVDNILPKEDIQFSSTEFDDLLRESKSLLRI